MAENKVNNGLLSSVESAQKKQGSDFKSASQRKLSGLDKAQWPDLQSPTVQRKFIELFGQEGFEQFMKIVNGSQINSQPISSTVGFSGSNPTRQKDSQNLETMSNKPDSNKFSPE